MLSETQAQKVADRTGTALVSVMRRLLGWPVRGRAGLRIDKEIDRWGVRLRPDGEIVAVPPKEAT